MADYSVKYDSMYKISGIPVYQKIMPDSYRLNKDVASYALAGQPLKACRKMRTGKPLGITVHNTGDIYHLLSGIKSAAEQYILSTYNGNMGGSMVHYYVSDGVIWQLLNDTEQGWHSGTGNATKIGNRGVQIGGNVDTISIECVGASAGAEATAAALVAYLCMMYDLDPVLDVYTHQFWSGKYCPAYILPHWDSFSHNVEEWKEWYELLTYEQWKEYQEKYEKEQESQKPDDWAIESQIWCKSNGISDGTYPKRSITRQEVWTMLKRFWDKFVK